MILKGIAKDTVIYGAGDFVGRLIAFLVFPIVATALSPRDFGVLDLIMTGVSLCSLIIGCGLNNAAQRYYWDADVSLSVRPVIVSSGLFVQTVFGAVFFVLGYFLYQYFKGFLAAQNLPIGGLAIFSALLLTLATQWLLYIRDVTRLHFKPVNFLILSVFVKAISAILGLVVLVVFHQGLDEYIFAQMIVLFLSLPAGLWMIREDLTFHLDKQWTFELLKYGYPFIFVIIAHWIFGSMDRWMLAAMASIPDTGIYSVSFRFSSIVVFMSTAFGLAWSPQAVKIKTDHPKRYAEIYGMVLLFLLYVMLVVGGGLSLFSGEIIGLIMPPDYAGAALPLVVLSFAAILQSTLQISAVGISLSKKTHIFAHLAWVTAGLNLIGNYFLIPKFGPMGAAVTTMFSYFILTCAYTFYTQKLDPIKLFWKPLLGLTFLGSLVGVVSIQFNSLEFIWHTVLIKFMFALCCMLLGAFALPVKQINSLLPEKI